jgi:hypothetical protein
MRSQYAFYAFYAFCAFYAPYASGRARGDFVSRHGVMGIFAKSML